MRIHEFMRLTEPEIFVWARPRSTRRWTVQGIGQGQFDHIYRVPRGSPNINIDTRRWWNPYHLHHIDALTPICGPLRTSATRGTISLQRFLNRCPECETLNPNGLTNDDYTNTILTDPWTQRRNMNLANWWLEPDPISGV